MYRVDREQVPVILFLLLTIIAIGLVASTINSVTGIEGGRDIQIQPRDAGTADDDPEANLSVEGGNGSAIQQQGQVVDLTICIPFLTRSIAPVGIVGLIVFSLSAIYYRYNIATAFLFGTGIVPITLASYFFLTNCIGSSGAGGQGLLSGSDVISNSQEGLTSAPQVPPTLMAVAFGGVMIAAAAMLYTMTGEEETPEPTEEEPAEPARDDFARAAGRAADRIEEGNVSVDNSVYQAWLEMTGLFDIENPDSATPLDFAEAAIAAGIDESDVRELTRLFNEVRYGDRSPADREERAMEILRRIERTYRDDAGGEA